MEQRHVLGRSPALTLLRYGVLGFVLLAVPSIAGTQRPMRRQDAIAAARGNPHLIAMVDQAEAAFVEGTFDPATEVWNWCQNPSDFQVAAICQYIRQLPAVPDLAARRRETLARQSQLRAAGEAEARRARERVIETGRAEIQRLDALIRTVRAEALAMTEYDPAAVRAFEARINAALSQLSEIAAGASIDLSPIAAPVSRLAFTTKDELTAHVATLLPRYGADLLARSRALTWRDGPEAIRRMIELGGIVMGDAQSAGLVHRPGDPPEPPDLPTALAYEGRRLRLVLQEIDEVRSALSQVCGRLPEQEAVLREEIRATRGRDRQYLEQELAAVQGELRDRRRFLEAHGLRPGPATCAERNASP